MKKSVVILGTGRTLSKFDEAEHSSSEIWAVGSAFSILKEKNTHVDKYFTLHKNETIEFDGEIVNQSNYPLDEIMSKFDSRFFTNSISYMLAFALYYEVDSISMYGVDMDSESEYNFERPSVAYWIGFAKGLSVEVFIASGLDNPIFLYGFDDTSVLLSMMRERAKFSYDMAKHHMDLGDMKKSDQFLGQSADNQYWIRELMG